MRANEFLRQGVTEGFLDKFFKPKKVKPEMIMNIKKGNGELYVEVYMGEDSTYWIARFTFDMIGDTLKAQDISVTDEYRGRGIAKWVYDTLKNKGYTINRSPYQTDDGKHFWDKNKGANAKVWEQGVAEGTSNITYKQQKGKNKFSIEMSVDGRSAGIFQYDADTGRTLVELDPAFRGQGLGQRLILKGIYTAAMLGMNYVEDESRTQMFDRAMDSLADAGYIVQDEEYWYVTSNGEQFLKQGVTEGYSNTTFQTERRRLNVPALIKAGALFVTYPHGEQGWETDNQEDWAYSLISLYNVMKGGWPAEAKKYLKPASYKKAEQQINSSAPNLGSDKLVYDGKYNQILWSIKKLGIPNNVAFLDNDNQGVAEGKLNEIYKMPPTKNSSQGMAIWAYNDAVEKKSPVLYKNNNVIVFKVNEDLLRYIILQDDNPVLYIGLSKFLDGYKSGTVATEIAGRGKGLAQKAYLNASDILGVPIYSDTTQTDASRLGIWNKLIQQYPDRIVGYDQKTNKNLPLSLTNKGPVVNQNQPIYVGINKKDTNKPVTPNQRYRTRILKLLPNKQGVSEDSEQKNTNDLNEKWSQKYKRSIDCSHPKGFSQRAHCQGRKKNEDTIVERKRKRTRKKTIYVGHGYYPALVGDGGSSGEGS